MRKDTTTISTQMEGNQWGLRVEAKIKEEVRRYHFKVFFSYPKIYHAMSFHNKKHPQIKYLDLSVRYHEYRKFRAPKDNPRKIHEELRIRELEKENQILRIRLNTLENTLRKMINKTNGYKN